MQRGENEMSAHTVRQLRDRASGRKRRCVVCCVFVESDQYGVVIPVRIRQALIGAGVVHKVDAVGEADAGVRDVIRSGADARTFLANKQRPAIAVRVVGQIEGRLAVGSCAETEGIPSSKVVFVEVGGLRVAGKIYE